MSVVYITAGILFFFFPIIPNIDLWTKFAIGGLLVLYGIFRLIRAIRL